MKGGITKAFMEKETLDICNADKCILDRNREVDSSLNPQEVSNYCWCKAKHQFHEERTKLIRNDLAKFDEENAIYLTLPRSKEKVHSALEDLKIKTKRDEVFLHAETDKT